MPIPDFQSAMLPVLQLSADRREHSLAEALAATARAFAITQAEIEQMLPSGRQTTLYSRVGWAKTYLVKSGLLEAAGRGRFRITQRGMDVLASNSSRVDVALLTRVSGNSPRGRSTAEEPVIAAIDSERTPEETLEQSFQLLRSHLADELLERVKACSPGFFENLVVDLLVTMGYGGSRREAGRVVGQSGDEGIDGLINEDPLGLDVVYVQAKRWKATVGRPDIQAFAGSLEGKRARKGVFITTSDFSREARDYVKQIEKKIVLLDGAELASLMIEHGVGVSEIATYILKRVELDYFGEEEGE